MRLFGRRKRGAETRERVSAAPAEGGKKGLSLRALLPAVLGLAVAAASWLYLQQYLATHQKTEEITVPARDIPPYTVITDSDLMRRTILAGAREPGAAITPGELAGRMALVPLYRGEQVRRERLADPAEADRFLVTVAVDPVRANGVEPGDLVDVYLVKSEDVPGALLASDARVVALRDGNGNPLVRQPPAGLAGAVQQAAQPGAGVPAMATLAVRPGDAPQVIRGAANGSKGIALVRKFRPGGFPAAPPVGPEGAGSYPAAAEVPGGQGAAAAPAG